MVNFYSLNFSHLIYFYFHNFPLKVRQPKFLSVHALPNYAQFKKG